jgi:hypothetical protein
MKMIITAFLYAFLFCFSLTINGQENLLAAQKEWKGFYFGVGVQQMHLLNDVYATNFATGLLEGGAGISYKAQFRFSAFLIDFNYANLGFVEKDIAPNPYNDSDPIRVPLFETSLCLNILPDNKWLSPYVGGGYTFGGIVLPEEASFNGKGAMMNISNPLFNCGLALKLKWFAFEGYYKRTFGIGNNKGKDLYAFGGSILFHFSKFLKS